MITCRLELIFIKSAITSSGRTIKRNSGHAWQLISMEVLLMFEMKPWTNGGRELALYSPETAELTMLTTTVDCIQTDA